MITAINMHCPYCSEIIRITQPKTSGKLLGNHIVKNHPEIAKRAIENRIKIQRETEMNNDE